MRSALAEHSHFAYLVMTAVLVLGLLLSGSPALAYVQQQFTHGGCTFNGRFDDTNTYDFSQARNDFSQCGQVQSRFKSNGTWATGPQVTNVSTAWRDGAAAQHVMVSVQHRVKNGLLWSTWKTQL